MKTNGRIRDSGFRIQEIIRQAASKGLNPNDGNLATVTKSVMAVAASKSAELSWNVYENK